MWLVSMFTGDCLFPTEHRFQAEFTSPQNDGTATHTERDGERERECEGAFKITSVTRRYGCVWVCRGGAGFPTERSPGAMGRELCSFGKCSFFILFFFFQIPEYQSVPDSEGKMQLAGRTDVGF